MSTTNAQTSRRAHRATGRPVGRPAIHPELPGNYSVQLEPAERAALADGAAKHGMTIPIMIRRWIELGCPLAVGA